MAAENKKVKALKEKKPLSRQSSGEWSLPTCNDDDKFAIVTDGVEGFHADIDLKQFKQFDAKDIEIVVHGYDVHFHASRPHPTDPSLPDITITRQYRLPPDTDLETVKLVRDKKTGMVTVDAKKSLGYGKAVEYSVVDVTKHYRPTVQLK
ncbi:hypothetical protein AB6A40_004988 [Gnathostoma spinigerum]|uniref:SHSP domain-containing protein n=1 Tax=Gnathostoma spinigerum TaxID=75299 RepID=A0ABD6EJF4_9BILA